MFTNLKNEFMKLSIFSGLTLSLFSLFGIVTPTNAQIIIEWDLDPVEIDTNSDGFTDFTLEGSFLTDEDGQNFFGNWFSFNEDIGVSDSQGSSTPLNEEPGSYLNIPIETVQEPLGDWDIQAPAIFEGPSGEPVFGATATFRFSEPVTTELTASALEIDVDPLNDNFQESIEPVPEPLTILGSGLALGFGAYFKKEYSRKQKNAKAKA